MFLAYLLLPFLLGLLFLRETRYLKRLALGMAFSQRVRMGMVAILAIYTLHFHIFYSWIQPVTYGFYLSFFYMLTFISLKRHERMLFYLRADQRRLIVLGLASIFVACIPGMLTIGVTMAYTLVFACLFPRKSKERLFKIDVSSSDKVINDTVSQTCGRQ